MNRVYYTILYTNVCYFSTKISAIFSLLIHHRLVIPFLSIDLNTEKTYNELCVKKVAYVNHRLIILFLTLL